MPNASLKFASLGSGSKGNATLVACNNSCIMIDCGFGIRDVENRLQAKFVSPENISAILVTHEHGDHIRGVSKLANKYNIPVWLTRGTACHNSIAECDTKNYIDVHDKIDIGELEITPFPVPHDAKEPCQFIVSNGNKRLGILTDTGSITPHIIELLSGCHGLILECNHDIDMLQDGPYPLTLKQRVGGDYGHLSNEQAAYLLQQADTTSLKHIVAAHISEKNNDPALARAALSDVLSCEFNDIVTAEQADGFDWLTL